MPSNVGNVEVTLTANQAQFIAGIKEAVSHVEGFGGSVTRSQGHVQKFSAHMLTTRAAVGTFASVIGESSGALMHFVHGFMIGGPIIGSAVAAILLFKESMASLTEETKKNSDEMQKRLDIIKHMKELEGKSIPETSTQKKLDEERKELANQRNELQQRLRGGKFEFEQFSDVFFHPIKWFTGSAMKERREEAEVKYKKLTQELVVNTELSKQEAERPGSLPGDRNQGVSAVNHHIKAVAAGELGIFKLEHSAADPSIQYLQQIAKNTAKSDQPAFKDQAS